MEKIIIRDIRPLAVIKMGWLEVVNIREEDEYIDDVQFLIAEAA